MRCVSAGRPLNALRTVRSEVPLPAQNRFLFQVRRRSARRSHQRVLERPRREGGALRPRHRGARRLGRALQFGQRVAARRQGSGPLHRLEAGQVHRDTARGVFSVTIGIGPYGRQIKFRFLFGYRGSDRNGINRFGNGYSFRVGAVHAMVWWPRGLELVS